MQLPMSFSVSRGPFPTIFINMAHHTLICLCTRDHPPLSFCYSAPLYVTFSRSGFVGFLIGWLLPGALLLYCGIDIFRHGPRLARTWLAWGWQTICALSSCIDLKGAVLDDVHRRTTFIIRKDGYYPCCGTISCHCNAAHAYTSRVSPGSVGSKYILSNHT
ncbi:hypothetical protein HD554DRAFT_1670773 [Boletus coccyginus]|nr:hypothetical protein HD554DRAFT_1670773 [Boletus coccyginus]